MSTKQSTIDSPTVEAVAVDIPATSTDHAAPRTDRHGRPRLPLPDAVDLGSIRWIYAVPIVAMHLLALLAFVPWLFTWTGLILMLVGTHVFGQAINMCYHRQLTHRAYVTPRWLEHFFVVVALCCMQDSPGKWVATHRYHHQWSDEQPDPHSPMVSFLWAHVGWLLARNRATSDLAMYQKYARDVLSDPFYMRLEKNRWLMFYIYVAHAALFFLAGFGVGCALHGWSPEALRFGLSILVWGVIVRTVVVWHITWSVNSLTHLIGYRNYETGENSRNSFLVAFLTMGEGWHNNHHHDQTAATNQHRWWEVDVVYYQIVLLKWLGLARDVVPLREKRIAAAKATKR